MEEAKDIEMDGTVREEWVSRSGGTVRQESRTGDGEGEGDTSGPRVPKVTDGAVLPGVRFRCPR